MQRGTGGKRSLCGVARVSLLQRDYIAAEVIIGCLPDNNIIYHFHTALYLSKFNFPSRLDYMWRPSTI